MIIYKKLKSRLSWSSTFFLIFVELSFCQVKVGDWNSLTSSLQIRDIQSIEKALAQALSMKRDSILNPFDGGDTSLRILEVLENIDLKDILKKKFYDL